jgi:hypothetical protein
MGLHHMTKKDEATTRALMALATDLADYQALGEPGPHPVRGVGQSTA